MAIAEGRLISLKLGYLVDDFKLKRCPVKNLFLSPHYDDAVYSCGGTIFQLARMRSTVTILTLMAGQPTPPIPQTPIVEDNHQRWNIGDNPVLTRRDEDIAAATILGASTDYCDDIPDCIYRTANGEALYPNEESLWGAPHPDDPALSRLRRINLENVETLYAPLAVGNHIDHQIVRDWAIELSVQYPDMRVFLYEDYPYMREPKAIKDALSRLAHPGRQRSMMLTERAILKKISAMRAYQSQLSSFWDDEQSLDVEVRQTFSSATMAGYTERFYQLA